jgi:hypothetical protein
VRLFAYRGVAYEPYLNSGTRGKRPASSSGTVGGGKPADNVPDGSSQRAIGLPLRPMLTNGALPREGTCVSVVTTEEGNG